MNYVKLSKSISYFLRHNPDDLGIELDKEGYVTIDEFLSKLNANFDFPIKKEDIVYIVNNQSKKRFEIVDDKIRALYGHTNGIKNDRLIIPPDELYHGTTKKAYEKIKTEGIKKMDREYVHMTNSIEEAKHVAFRRSKDIVILKINTRKAHDNGVKFYEGNDKIFLCDYVEPEYFLVVEE